mgnify:CR=1 FL=1
MSLSISREEALTPLIQAALEKVAVTTSEPCQRMAHHQHSDVVMRQPAALQHTPLHALAIAKTNEGVVVNTIKAGGGRYLPEQPTQAGSTGFCDVNQEQSGHAANIQAWGVGDIKSQISPQLAISCASGSGLMRRCSRVTGSGSSSSQAHSCR